MKFDQLASKLFQLCRERLNVEPVELKGLKYGPPPMSTVTRCLEVT